MGWSHRQSLSGLRRAAAVAAAALFVAACAGGTTPSGGAATPSGGQSGQTAPAGEKIGGTVSVLATWGGDEQASFMAMVKPFEDRTGIRIEYEGTRDLNAILTTRVQGGNPPDVAGLPGPGQMAQFARAGSMVDLGPILDQSQMQQWYTPDWLKLGQVEGKQYGIFIKASMKGGIWHDPKVWQQQGFQPPKTWNDLMQLSRTMAQGGTAPWCIGLESGATSGWPGTDWIENIVLRQAGPQAYDEWHEGKLKWTSPQIKQAWQTWGQIVTDPQMVYGGRQAMLATAFGDAGLPMFANPPRCYMEMQGSFITSFYTGPNPNLKPGQDFDFFLFPEFDSTNGSSIEVGADLFGAFRDTPQVRALMQYLASPEAQSIWVKRGGAISPNRLVEPSAYPDPLSAKAAQIMASAQTVRFDASDLMPEAMNNAFLKGILDYVNNPGSLDSILENLDRVQSDAYRS